MKDNAATPGLARHVDVLIVGAGISGIDAAYHLAKECPGKSFQVLEALESFGGTWLTHRYPGVRSDSDLYTFGYSFKPWVGAPIASAAEIRKYLGEVIAENGLDARIRYGFRATNARWSSQDNRWTVEGVTADGAAFQVTCAFLWMCQGYYRHAEGYTPPWRDMDRYRGRIVHPQTWPDDLDYAGKRVVIIGSGATAATVAPAMARDCAHITLLQRSPTYFFASKNRHWLADLLRELKVDERWIHEIVRRKIVDDQFAFAQRAVREPEAVRAELLKGISAFLPPDEVARHFNPAYRPWQQRIAVVPDGDLFEAMREGQLSVVTDHIERFTETGLKLKSGASLEADLIITATGFNMSFLGDIAFEVDGRAVDFAETFTWRGTMFTGVPNLVWVLGYFRAASWTLKADLLAAFVCRLLDHMTGKGAARIEVALRPEDEGMPALPWIDSEVFNPGYLMRGMHLLPKRGDKPEWAHSQDYWLERDVLPTLDLDDPIFRYGGVVAAAETETAGPAAP
jgi:cation diffusion facilitator CzcD-associated flavoprotein CzcO